MNMKVRRTHIIRPITLGTIMAARMPAAAPSIPAPGQMGTSKLWMVDDVLKAAEAVDELDGIETREEDGDRVTVDIVKDVKVVLGWVIVVTGIEVVKTFAPPRPELTDAAETEFKAEPLGKKPGL